MKKALLISSILVSNFSFAQQYDGVKIEKSRVDKNNLIYTLGKEFIFSFEIADENSLYYLKKNDAESFQLDKNKDSVKISEIHLTIIKPKLFKRTNKNQTELLYSYEPNPRSITRTGGVENEYNVWIHPPRDGFFKSLETCPFPYIKLVKPIGYTWTDSMRIGDHRADKLWGEWESRLLLKYNYEIEGHETITTEFGRIDCTVINAEATSKIGQSRLKAYFSDKYGFVKLDYTLFTGIKVMINLLEIKKNPLLRDGKDFFKNKYK